MTKISLVMIVKDEAKTLRACLESVRAIVDEFIVVDTGSTDGTQDIIREYAGQVRELPFIDFVTTKNAALALATGDYILFMDADERMVGGLRELREHAEAGVDAVYGRIIEGDPVANTYQRARLWRNKPEHRFVGPGVHEVIALTGSPVTDDSVVTLHDHSHRAPESYPARCAQYVGILRAWLGTHHDDPRALFYLARTYKDWNLPLHAIGWYERYLASGSTFRDERWQAAHDAGECWKGLGEHKRAREAWEHATRIDPRRAEAWTALGQLWFDEQRWEDAERMFARAASLPLPADVILFLNPRYYREIPADYLALCRDKRHDYGGALAIWQDMAARSPKPDARLINNIRCMRQNARRKIFFTLGHTPEPVRGGMLDEQGVGGVETTYLELPDVLAGLGHEVFVFCRTDHEHAHGGVRFIPYSELGRYESLEPDVVVTSRWFEPLYQFPQAKRIIWLQDAHFADPARPDAWSVADRVVCSSPWHRSYIANRYGQGIDARKLRVLPLGIRKAAFAGVVRRDPRKAIYSSNPDRGLYILMDMWPELCERVPGLHLAITYGWDGLRTWGDDPAWLAKIDGDQRRVEGWARAAGNVRITGRLRKADLYHEMQSAAICLYPNNFQETFCLTALETQAAGTPMVATGWGALTTTLDPHANTLISLDPFSPEYRRAFIDAAAGLLTNPIGLASASAACREHVANAALDWRDVGEAWQRMLWEMEE